MPTFIQRVAQDNVRGAAEAILTANPLGGMCARVCPTEVLCEQACVRNTNESKPVEIGLLQRFAVEGHFANPGARQLFERAQPTGKRVAVVGAGPAGLAAAHGLAWRGHDVALFDAAPKLGGLNEYGLATYKVAGGFAQKEIDWLLSIGGITPKLNCRLGRDITLDGLLADKAALTKVLTYHVVPGKVMAKDVKAGKVKTVQGQELTVSTSMGVMVDQSKVIATDVAASNGVIHAIDTVLMPK